MRKLLDLLAHLRRTRDGESNSLKLTDNKSRKELHRLVESARREWEAAECYFQTVSDTELVDHAIFSVEAAHRKYLYLFRQLRRTESPSDTQEGAM
jgi:hypothetical protein